MPSLAPVCLKDFILADEGMQGNASLFTLRPLLENDGVFALAKSTGKIYDRIFCCNHEFAVHNRVHLLVNPDIEP